MVVVVVLLLLSVECASSPTCLTIKPALGVTAVVTFAIAGCADPPGLSAKSTHTLLFFAGWTVVPPIVGDVLGARH